MAAFSTNRTAIVTRHWAKPMPDRRFDWVAFLEGQEERGEYGHGPTEAEAISDLVNNYLQQE